MILQPIDWSAQGEDDQSCFFVGRNDSGTHSIDLMFGDWTFFDNYAHATILEPEDQVVCYEARKNRNNIELYFESGFPHVRHTDEEI